MPLLWSPPARSDSGMNLRGDRRPIFYFGLKGFLDGQIRSMNRQRRRGMMIDGLQLVPAKPITWRIGKVQIALIKIEVGLFVFGKSASEAFQSIEFSFIQFEAFALDCPHLFNPASPGWLFPPYAWLPLCHKVSRKTMSRLLSYLGSNHLSLQHGQPQESCGLGRQGMLRGIQSRT